MRVVSLVPSLTEAVFALGLRPHELVGRTAWCIHPAEAITGARIVGGTKTPNLERIIALRPDLILMEREENELSAYEALRDRGLNVFVAHVMGVADVAPMLVQLAEALGHPRSADALVDEITAAMAAAPVVKPGPIAVPLIWHEPLMALAPHRYGGDLVRRAGFVVPEWPDSNGYPVVTPSELGALNVEVLLLTSEPHDFTEEEGRLIAEGVSASGARRPRPVKVDGEALTWFGARTGRALTSFARLAAELSAATS